MTTVYRRYFNRDLSWWQNFKNFYFTTKPLGREGYLVGLLLISMVFNFITMIFNPLGMSEMDEGIFGVIYLVLLMIFFLVSVILFTMLNIRRLHNLGNSGWWLVLLIPLSIIPGITVMWLLFALFKKGATLSNNYGPTPYEGEPVLRRYFPEGKSIWHSLKGFFTFKGRLSPFSFFWISAVVYWLSDLLSLVFTNLIWLILVLMGLTGLNFNFQELDALEDLYTNDDSLWWIVLGGIVSIFAVVAIIYMVFYIILGIAITVRRLHDVGYSGWWLLLLLVIGAGMVLASVNSIFINRLYTIYLLAVLYLFFIKKGTVGANKYGAEDKLEAGE